MHQKLSSVAISPRSSFPLIASLVESCKTNVVNFSKTGNLPILPMYELESLSTSVVPETASLKAQILSFYLNSQQMIHLKHQHHRSLNYPKKQSDY